VHDGVTIAVVPDSVRNERVFRARQIPIYALLTVSVLVGVAMFPATLPPDRDDVAQGGGAVRG
jgi:hypothetical protein